MFGVNGSGKTTHAKMLLDRCLREGWWAWVHDPNGDYKEFGPSYESGQDFIDAARRGPVWPVARFSCDPSELIRIDRKTSKAMEGGICWFASDVDPNDKSDRIVARPTIMLVDETAILDDDKKSRGQLSMLCARRRHYGCGLIYLVQVPVDMPKILTRLATEGHVFLLQDEDDLRTIKRRFGKNATPERLAAIERLGRGEYVVLKTRPENW